ncbi:MAG: gamma carbonic anhydrase family protein [Bdellovibrionales bacterium RBG_16_40_8]|nr:MAG: gamma carbonic anhydrase family protein [Bdellovibrionales bacterium RBG_16_40_8]
MPSMLMSLQQKKPKIGQGTFLAPTATLIGDVEIGQNCSIWFNAVLRGDVMPILIGDETNIQDGTIIHGTYNKCGATIGKRVTVGHGVILHGCEIGDRVLIGMGAIIMDKAKVSNDSFVAAGALITEEKEFPPGVLIVGRPAVVKRELAADELAFLNTSADNYIFYKKWYENGSAKIISAEEV